MNHSIKSSEFLKDQTKATWHDEALWFIRAKRDKASRQIPEWEELRSLAHQIKAHTLSNLHDYLLQFEVNALKNGIKVHWAKDAIQHNQIVESILESHQVKKLVKSKSMLTEDCGLNRYLESRKIEVIDTDLGERILQLSKEPPSHIVLPAIHKRKEEISKLFQEKLGTEPDNFDPTYLTEMARHHLRDQFLSSDAALTGVNFAIAETGGFVVCTNEGNADMGVHLAPVHIASMGMEKLIAKAEHLGVFLRLLARSGTGQPITVYSSHFHKPRKDQEMHIIIVDAGRSDILAQDDYFRSLYCIRCGACMNTCPVYRRSGGHSYGHTVPGPIGSILSPHVDKKKYASLPHASSLCGSCSDVCPVKIDIHEQLYKWRQKLSKEGNVSITKKIMMKGMTFVLNHPRIFRIAGSIGRRFLKWTPKAIIYNKFNTWGKNREIPAPPQQSFRDWYLKHRN